MKTTGNKRIAERYVKALADVSGKSQAQVEKDFAALGAALAESEDFRGFLTNPLLTREQQTQAVDAVLKGIKADKVTQQFMATLVAQKRLAILPDVIELYAAWAASQRGELPAELVTASALKPADIKDAQARLSKAFGKQVTLNVREDASLLGGVIVKVGSQQLDASLAGKIRRLKQSLKVA